MASGLTWPAASAEVRVLQGLVGVSDWCRSWLISVGGLALIGAGK
jgi:hypothetical protein